MAQPWNKKGDTATPFNKIHSSSFSLRQQMVELVQYSSIRTVARNWARSLRFLQPSISNSTFCGLPQIDRKTSLPHSDLAQLPGLTLTPRLDLVEGLDYVAISYCCQRTDISWFLEQKLPPILLTLDDQPLIHYTATDVLYRAARYASYKDVSNIWIDQYCINQEDLMDKLVGIQAMDLVYQNSSNPVILLETYIDDQAVLDVLASLLKGDMITADQIDSLEHFLDVL